MLVVVGLLFAGGGYRVVKMGKSGVAFFSLAIGLVLMSVLMVEPKPLDSQPYPDTQEVADSTWQLVNGNGFVTYLYDNQPRPPRYTPGFALALAPFALMGDDYPRNVQRGATFWAAVYVLAAVIAAWSLKGPMAGALIAMLIGVSPFARVAASLVMSDAFAAGITALILALIVNATPRRAALAGALAGALVVVRLPMILNVAALSLALPRRLATRMLLCALPPLVALAIYNWVTFGDPFTTGYQYWRPGAVRFHLALAFLIGGDGPWVVADAVRGGLLSWLVCPCPPGGPQAALPNVYFYPALITGLFWVFTPPLVPWIGIRSAWIGRREVVGSFVLWLTILSMAFFTFYFYQATRFMAAPATALGILTSASLAGWISRGGWRSTSRLNGAALPERIS
jgi:hypothetical protein